MACHELFGLMMGDKIEGGAAETAAGRGARAEASGLGAGKVHEEVKFGSAVFEKVARAFMALKHVLAEQAVIVFTQGGCTMNHALDFSDNMPGALILTFGEFGLVGGDEFGVRKTERRHAERMGGGFAKLAKIIVARLQRGNASLPNRKR